MKIYWRSVCLSFLLALFSFLGQNLLSRSNNKEVVHKAHLSSGWYPQNKIILEKDLRNYFSIARKNFGLVVDSNKVKVLIVPHAGYYYSGLCAATAYQVLFQDSTVDKFVKNKRIKRVIVMSPSHVHSFHGIALPGYTKYKTILGDIDVDRGAISWLKEHALFKVLSYAHVPEHAIEVQLPFLQNTIEEFKIIPLVVGNLTRKDYEQVSVALSNVIDDKTLVVISSDFTHYGINYDYVPFSKNIVNNIQRTDSKAIEAISNNSLVEFDNVLHDTKATICGRNAIKILLNFIEQGIWGDLEARLASYYTSVHLVRACQKSNNNIDVDLLIGGLPDSLVKNCVSYAGIVFTQEKVSSLKAADQLTNYEKRALLNLARETLENLFAGDHKKKESLLFPILSLGVKKIAGAFVTLNTKSGDLRGCIGRVIADDQPLFSTITEVAKSAALNDFRFKPLSKEELDDIVIDITILTPPVKVKSYNDIQLGRHGIILKKRLASGLEKSALFLPQVPGSFNWDLKTTLQHLSIKAGLGKDGWTQNCKFEVFEGFEIKED